MAKVAEKVRGLDQGPARRLVGKYEEHDDEHDEHRKTCGLERYPVSREQEERRPGQKERSYRMWIRQCGQVVFP